MQRVILGIVFILTAFVAPISAQVQTTYEGYYEVLPYGNDTTYMRAFTHRRVNGELRFLSLTWRGDLLEFTLPSAFGQKSSGHGRDWSLGPTGALGDFTGIWWEQDKNRLWVSSGPDYTANYSAAHVTILSLSDTSSTATVVKHFYLSVPGKRAYGGCSKVPAGLVSALGGAYVCGYGGYTSLVEQGGAASMGPTMYAIPDPDMIANGSTVTVRVVLDTHGSRGVRATIPTNYFDGGDPRQNPGSRPTSPPASSGSWLSPNADGQGWFVWGDSYYNTGVWIGETFASIASLCKGSCWYQSSTLAFDGRQFELHQWNGRNLGTNILKRPDSMVELPLPDASARVWGGNSATGNIAGATYDSVTGKIYAFGVPFGSDDYTGRVFQIGVGGAPPPPPPVVDADAEVTDWSAWVPTGDWSICVAPGVQTRSEERTRTVVTPAMGTGTTPPLRETRVASRACTPPQPEPEPEPDPTLTARVNALEAAIAALHAEVAQIQLTPGPKGDTGDPGADGATGPQGPQGVAGADGASVTLEQVRAIIASEVERVLAAIREVLR